MYELNLDPPMKKPMPTIEELGKKKRFKFKFGNSETGLVHNTEEFIRESLINALHGMHGWSEAYEFLDGDEEVEMFRKQLTIEILQEKINNLETFLKEQWEYYEESDGWCYIQNKNYDTLFFLDRYMLSSMYQPLQFKFKYVKWREEYAHVNLKL